MTRTRETVSCLPTVTAHSVSPCDSPLGPQALALSSRARFFHTHITGSPHDGCIHVMGELGCVAVPRASNCAGWSEFTPRKFVFGGVALQSAGVARQGWFAPMAEDLEQQLRAAREQGQLQAAQSKVKDLRHCVAQQETELQQLRRSLEARQHAEDLLKAELRMSSTMHKAIRPPIHPDFASTPLHPPLISTPLHPLLAHLTARESGCRWPSRHCGTAAPLPSHRALLPLLVVSCPQCAPPPSSSLLQAELKRRRVQTERDLLLLSQGQSSEWRSQVPVNTRTGSHQYGHTPHTVCPGV